tara:strand:- start:2238 stop:2894 length:657 start_codon:yes stop_codon:yes gene_type:complete
VKKINYDTAKYDFARLIKTIFDCEDLTKLHEKLPENIEYKELHKIGEDNKTWYHKKFYEPINNGDMEFVNVYRNFVREIITPLMHGEDFIFQRVPTFRVHAPGNVAVGGWHRDIDYNHSEHEINFFVPFTVAFGTNTMWVESEPNKKDFSPFEADYGDAYMWNGAILLHGNKPNTTGQTRVSVDFRVMKRKHYNENESKQSISRGTKFITGEYYDTFN